MKRKNALKKGQLIDIVLMREKEILARHEAGESWNSIEREIRCGKCGGTLVKTLRAISAQRIRENKTPLLQPLESWDDDDFTSWFTKKIDPRMRKSFWQLLQEYYFMKSVATHQQKEFKEKFLYKLIGVTSLKEIDNIDAFMTVYVELVKVTFHLEDLHRLLLLPRVKKGMKK